MSPHSAGPYKNFSIHSRNTMAVECFRCNVVERAVHVDMDMHVQTAGSGRVHTRYLATFLPTRHTRRGNGQLG